MRNAADRSRSAARRWRCRPGVPAGDGGGRGRRWRALVLDACARRESTSPTCSAASARSRCGSREARGSTPSTATPARSPRLQKAATATSGLKPIKAEVRDLFRRPLMPQELRRFDASCSIRRGRARRRRRATGGEQSADGGRAYRATSRPSRAMRAILIDGGYRLDGVTPVDQFRHTPHVEMVARFSERATVAPATAIGTHGMPLAPSARCQICSPIVQ